MSRRARRDLQYPLETWTRRLTADEREADIRSDLEPFRFTTRRDVDPDNGERWQHLVGWLPVLPPQVAQCPLCKLPQEGAQRCPRCKELVARYGQPVDSLELLTVVNKREPPETDIWAYKVETTLVDGVWMSADYLLQHIAPRLSAYTEAHADRLLVGDPVLTAIPSRAPVIGGAFHKAVDDGLFALKLVVTGHKIGDWCQHGSSAPERRTRTADDWKIESDMVAGRPVVVFDDVFQTGASMSSYAIALKAAGATEVRGVVIGRDVSYTHRDYYDAVRILRRGRIFHWSPGRANVYYPSS